MGINLGRRIRQVRESLGMSQLEFGAAIGIHTQAAISRYERGFREPEGEVLERIAALAGKPVAWLLEGAAASEVDELAEFRELCRAAAGKDIPEQSELVREAQGDRAALAFMQLQSIVAGLLEVSLKEASRHLADGQAGELTTRDLYRAFGSLLAEGQFVPTSNHLALLHEIRRTQADIAKLYQLMKEKGDR